MGHDKTPAWLWIVIIAFAAIDVFIIGKFATSLVSIILLIIYPENDKD